MKTELIEFIENDLGFPIPLVKKSIRKYFRGKEVEWDNKYVHEIDEIYNENGEVYIKGSFGTIVFNADNIYTNLPHLIACIFIEREKANKNVCKQLTAIINNSNL
jgi:hypothetical protein